MLVFQDVTGKLRRTYRPKRPVEKVGGFLMPAAPRHPLEYVISCRPLVWWYVAGRKIFGTESVAIRRSWKIGRYAGAE